MPPLIAAALLVGTGLLFAALVTAPAPPVILEPQTDGQIVSPSDVHMETGPMSDPDGGGHQCSDWQIRLASDLEIIWQSLCLGGLEKVHTHLGDGSFIGSYAGRTELVHDTAYFLEVRHIDDADEISPWSQRAFTTGPATQVFSLELDDILAVPLPALKDASGSPVILPAAVTQPFVRVEAPDGQLLLQFSGLNGLTNLVNNPPPLPAHVPVRVQVSAGSVAGGLVLPEADLTFVDDEGTPRGIYLPSLSIPPSESRFFWVSVTGSTYTGAVGQTTPDFSQLARGAPVPWNLFEPGYRVEVVATGFQLPVHLAFVPDGLYPGDPDDPLYYVAELYGQIKVVSRDGTVSDYATGLLNFNPTGNFPGSGEQGVAGVTVDPVTGDVFASMIYSEIPFDDTALHFGKIDRFQSVDGGRTALTRTTVLDMAGEWMGQSHQVSKLTIGPDGRLYAHVGDGFSAPSALNLDFFRGKILRLNLDGSAPADNPHYTGGGGPRDYVYASGFRNPFGGAWRASDSVLYEVENGPSTDRLARVLPGAGYGWSGSNADMLINALYNWTPSHAPVDMTFIQTDTFGGSGFPMAVMDRAYVTESGPTWASGPQTRGKRIIAFEIIPGGAALTPTTLIEYSGAGKATTAGVAAGPDGLYFSDLYRDTGYILPTDVGANVLRVKYVGVADFTAAPAGGETPLRVNFTDLSDVPGASAWLWNFGDGTTSSVRNPAHTFIFSGTYTVRLQVTGSEGVLFAEDTIDVTQGAVAPRLFLPFVRRDGSGG